MQNPYILELRKQSKLDNWGRREGSFDSSKCQAGLGAYRLEQAAVQSTDGNNDDAASLGSSAHTKLLMNDKIRKQGDFLLRQIGQGGPHVGPLDSPLPAQIQSPKLHSTLTEAQKIETEALAREKQQKRRSLFQNHLDDSLADEESDQSEGSAKQEDDSKVVLVNDQSQLIANLEYEMQRRREKGRTVSSFKRQRRDRSQGGDSADESQRSHV